MILETKYKLFTKYKPFDLGEKIELSRAYIGVIIVVIYCIVRIKLFGYIE